MRCLPGVRVSASVPSSPGQAELICPVCWWPDHDTVRCDQCGWGLVPDSVADARYLAACQLHDLRAAMRVSGLMVSCDQARFDRLAGFARGGPPDGEQLQGIAADVVAEERAVTGTRFALTRLIAGETDAIAFIEIGPDTLAMDALVVDELGIPVRSGRETISWTDVLPRLPGDADLRHFRMAGGIGADLDQADGPATLRAAISETAKYVLARLMAAAAAWAARSRRDRSDGPRLDTVLVRRTHQWPLLEEAENRARAIVRPIADIFMPPGAGALEEVVDSLVQGAPLKYGYYLILAAVDQATGTVTPRAHPLFAAGAAAAPDAPLTVPITVKPPERAARRLALPIVARLHAGEEQHWPPPLVQMAAADGTRTGSTQLTVQLEAPGRVSVWGTPPLPSPDAMTADWPQLLSELPSRIHPVVSLDLALLIELGGDEDTVADRVGLARALVEAIGAPADVRVAVIGYRDHFGKHRHSGQYRRDATQDVRDQEDKELLVGCELSQADAVRLVLAVPERWQAVPVRDLYAAPVEDALRLVAQPEWAWRPRAQHVLAIIGGRPPHPAKMNRVSGPAVPCPHRYSWQDSLGHLQRNQDVTCVAVFRGRARSDGDVERAWQMFTSQGGLVEVSPEPEQLVRLAGLPARGGAAQLRLATYVSSTPIRSTRREASR